MTGADFAQGSLLALFAAALLIAVAADIRCKRVRRWIWMWAGSAALLLFGLRMRCGPGDLGDAGLQTAGFILLQFLVFDGMYGRADCFAFSCCSILLGAFGGGILEYLVHMLLSIALLGIVQMRRGNVNGRGNLKEPVAFIPYIAAALPPVLLGLMRKIVVLA